jgi:sugar phosphate isomerase/epimerase
VIPTLNVTDDRTHCGHLGHVVDDFAQACALAARHGFAAVNLDLSAERRATADAYRRVLDSHGLVAAAFGFPVDLFAPGADFSASVEEFSVQTALAAEIGCRATLCYLPPFSHDLPFHALFTRTVERLRLLRPALERHGVRIGFEPIGPTETRRGSRHDFVHTLDGTRALIAAAGIHDHGGFKLDVHHWQWSGAGLLDLHHLDPNYLVYVELNDGLPGYDLATMPEFNRALPLATGVNDVLGFLRALAAKGYRGPVAVEPWSAEIASLPLDEAAATVKAALDRCLALVAS